MNKLNPWYVTGLTEGEGSFCVSFNLKRRLTTGIETRPSFSLTLNRRDLNLLKDIRAFFGCGAIRFSRSDRTYKYESRSIKDIRKRIIPHFMKFPLRGEKLKDFWNFRKICRMISANQHLSVKFLPEIIKLAYEMNPSGKRKYSKEYLLRVLDEVKG